MAQARTDTPPPALTGGSRFTIVQIPLHAITVTTRRSASRRRAPRSSSLAVEILLIEEADIAVDRGLRDLDAVDLEQLRVAIDDAIERHPDRPRPREHGRILDRRLVLQVVRADRRVAFDDASVVAHEVAGAIEPREAVQPGDLDHERVAVPAAVRGAHPGVDGRLDALVAVHDAARLAELVDEQDLAVPLQDLERIRHVRRTRYAGHEALELRIAVVVVRQIFHDEAIGEVVLLALERPRLIWDLVA